MKIKLLTLGHKMPGWLSEGFDTFNHRLPSHLQLQEINLPAEPRKKGLSVEHIKTQEWLRLKKHIDSSDYTIAFDERGKFIDSGFIAKQLGEWELLGYDVNLIIGGADGLADAAKQSANAIWSLSKLVFPHHLVKVIIAEQMYRAHSMRTNHPYHRE